MKKVYFAGSIRGGREDRAIYEELIALISSYATVLTEHIADINLTSNGEANLSDQEIYQRDVDWIREADLVIAEVTQPSLGVGYELAYAESIDKPVCCLFRESSEKRLSAMIAGNAYFKVINYNTAKDLKTYLKPLLKNVDDE